MTKVNNDDYKEKGRRYVEGSRLETILGSLARVGLLQALNLSLHEDIVGRGSTLLLGS